MELDTVTRADGLPSVEVFARNVTDHEGLGFVLLAGARAELGPSACASVVERRASDLLLRALCNVGVDPLTERLQRDRLSRLLSGDPLADSEVQRAVDYILSQMIVQPKGALAECLAIPLCIERLDELKAERLLPANAEFKRGVWSRRLRGSDGEEDAVFEEWREGADGLYCAAPTNDMEVELDGGSSHQCRPGEHDLLVFGVVEVKCYRRVSRRALLSQLDRHIARLAGGLQLREDCARTVEAEYPPERLWYAVQENSRVRVLPVSDTPFELTKRTRRQGRCQTVDWTAPMMDSLIRLAVGPRAASDAGSGTRPRRHVFDAFLPYDSDELEEMGAAMAYYTLGAMADQPDLDLSWAEWSWNLERALQAVRVDALSERQLARRKKMLHRLR